MKFIVGKKIEMTQVWKADKVVAVTRVKIEPCVVTQVKTKDKDGYVAVQVGFGEKKEKNMKKPQQGHLKGLGNFRYLKEFRLEESVVAGLKRGDLIDYSVFAAGDEVKVNGTSKGKGFQGVVKRHGFSGSKKTHGNKDQLRMPGSIGSTGPAHVFKGMRMAGRMGGESVTVSNLEIVDIDNEKEEILIKGGVPGARNSQLVIYGEGDIKAKEIAETKEEAVEEKIEEQSAEEAAPETAEEKSDETASEAQPEENKEEASTEEKNQ